MPSDVPSSRGSFPLGENDVSHKINTISLYQKVTGEVDEHQEAKFNLKRDLMIYLEVGKNSVSKKTDRPTSLGPILHWRWGQARHSLTLDLTLDSLLIVMNSDAILEMTTNTNLKENHKST